MSASQDRKNIVLLSIDDMIDVVRYREAFGVPIQTPNIDALMERGVTFSNAFAASTLCNPSRTAVLTGQSPFATRVYDNEGPQISDVMPARDILIGQAHEAGWYTAARGKLLHGQKNGGAVGRYLDPILDDAGPKGGYAPTSNEFPGPLGDSPVPEPETYDGITAAWAVDFLGNPPAGTPFFLSVGIIKPHLCWNVPKRYYDLYEREDIVLPVVPDVAYEDLPAHFRNILYRDPGVHERILSEGPDLWGDALRGYLAAVSFADAQVGKVLDALTEAGLWETTTVLLWSDHGYHLGDREIWKKFTLWEEAASIPLVIADPDLGTPGSRVTTPVSTLDIWPTLSGLTGLPPPTRPDGLDLTPTLEDPEAHLARKGVITSVFGSISVRTEKSRYTLYPSGEEELFLVGRGQVFAPDVAERPGLAERLETMRGVLHREAAKLGVEIVAPGESARGTEGGDVFVLVGTAEARGGEGRDVYHLTPDATIVEEKGHGRDTAVIGTDTFWRLPDQVEDAILASASDGPVLATRKNNALLGNTHDNTFYALPGADLVDGVGGADRLWGGDGADTLIGGKGRDTLFGGRGRDSLSGDSGDDEITGGTGADIFRFRGGDGRDTVLDFEPDRDRISIGRGAERFEDLRIEADGADVLVRYGDGDQIRLVGVDIDEIGPWHFLF